MKKSNLFSIFKQVKEKCCKCNKTVYTMEKITINEMIFHNWCLKCSKCGTKLNTSNYHVHNDELFCKVHYERFRLTFKPKKIEAVEIEEETETEETEETEESKSEQLIAKPKFFDFAKNVGEKVKQDTKNFSSKKEFHKSKLMIFSGRKNSNPDSASDSSLSELDPQEILEKKYKNMKVANSSLFEAIKYDSKTKVAFESFLSSEFNLEPWEFLKEIDEFTLVKHTDREYIEKLFYLIDTYLENNSKKEINISGNLKNNLFEKIKNQKYIQDVWMLDESFESLFNPIRKKVYHELSNDSYSRFISSDYYVNLGNLDNEVVDFLPLREEALLQKKRKDSLNFNNSTPKNVSLNSTPRELNSTNSTPRTNGSPRVGGGYSSTHGSPKMSLSSLTSDYDLLSENEFVIMNSMTDFDELMEDYNENEIETTLRSEIGRKYFTKYLNSKSDQNSNLLLIDFMKEYYSFIDSNSHNEYINKIEEDDDESSPNDTINDDNLRLNEIINVISNNFVYNEIFVKQLLLIEMNSKSESTIKEEDTTNMIDSLKKVDFLLKNNKIELTMFDSIGNLILNFFEIVHEIFSETDFYFEMEKEIFEFEQKSILKSTEITGPIFSYLNIKEESELLNLIQMKMKNSKNGIKGFGNYFHKFQKYEKCFKGSSFNEWMMNNYPNLDSKEINEIGEQFINESYLHHIFNKESMILDNSIYKFNLDDDIKILNSNKKYMGNQITSIIHFQKQFEKKIKSLEFKFLKDSENIEHSQEFKEYLNFTIEFQSISIDSLNENERLCIFINIYNSLLLHIFIITGQSINNSFERLRFLNDYKYNIGGLIYSLNDLKHGILRSNSPIPDSNKNFYFSNKDKRIDFILTKKIPKIHFCLISGTKSEFKFKFYSLNSFEKELNSITCNYLNNELRINSKKRTVILVNQMKKF
eukprot:gene4850-8435_t